MSNSRRPMMTTPVASTASASTSASMLSPSMAQVCRASPPRPRPCPGSGPVTNPSSDTEMSPTTFAMTVPPTRVPRSGEHATGSGVRYQPVTGPGHARAGGEQQQRTDGGQRGYGVRADADRHRGEHEKDAVGRIDEPGPEHRPAEHQPAGAADGGRDQREHADVLRRDPDATGGDARRKRGRRQQQDQTGEAEEQPGDGRATGAGAGEQGG